MKNQLANSFTIKILQVGSLKTNCYLVIGKTSIIIIDPGDDAQYLSDEIQKLALKPELIIATHGHFDHIMAVNELKANFKIPFLMNKKDEKLLSWMRKSSAYFTHFDPGPPPVIDQTLSEKREIKIANLKAKIIEAPGHTPGSVCFYFEDQKILFAGDTIFERGGVGRTDFPYSNKKELDKSIKKLISLPEETLVYSGHGETTSIGEFKKYYSDKSDSFL